MLCFASSCRCVSRRRGEHCGLMAGILGTMTRGVDELLLLENTRTQSTTTFKRPTLPDARNRDSVNAETVDDTKHSVLTVITRNLAIADTSRSSSSSSSFYLFSKMQKYSWKKQENTEQGEPERALTEAVTWATTCIQFEQSYTVKT